MVAGFCSNKMKEVLSDIVILSLSLSFVAPISSERQIYHFFVRFQAR